VRNNVIEMNAEPSNGISKIAWYSHFAREWSGIKNASVGHAMTTHVFAVEGDYFSAGEELNILNETGAAITSYAFYGSGVYYQHATLDLSLLVRTLGEEGGYDLARTRDLVLAKARASCWTDSSKCSRAASATVSPAMPSPPMPYVKPGTAPGSITRLPSLTPSGRLGRAGISSPSPSLACAKSTAPLAKPMASPIRPAPQDGVGEVWTLGGLHVDGGRNRPLVGGRVSRHLVFTLYAPFGAFGLDSQSAPNQARKPTWLEPSKSAVVGLLGAALGTERARLGDLGDRLRLAVRVGLALTREAGADYHTITKASPPPGRDRWSRYEELKGASRRG
jgi:CRISPR-associated Cas5-like protein